MPHPAQPIDGSVAHNRQEPAPQGPVRRVKAVDLLPDRDKAVVHEVLRLLPVCDDAQGRGQCDRRVAVVQLAQRITVTGSNPLSQERVVGRRQSIGHRSSPPALTPAQETRREPLCIRSSTSRRAAAPC